jgi:hypothetical protein
MKKLVVLFVSILTINILCLNVNADEEIYFTNDNGVSMTREEYDYFVDLADEDYPSVITQDIYNKFVNYGYFGQPITKVEYDESAFNQQSLMPSVMPQGTVHETQAKKLVLGKTCANTFCGITVTLTWKGQPAVKSWDVIGVLLYGNLTLMGDPTTYLHYSGGNIFYNDPYYVGGGLGVSVKMQTSTTNMRVYQSYDVYGDGTVFASYQHATSSITKATSQLYTVGYGGYGGVFHFYGAASGVYDHMGGVNTAVSI